MQGTYVQNMKSIGASFKLAKVKAHGFNIVHPQNKGFW